MAYGRAKAMPRNIVPGETFDGLGSAAVVDKNTKRIVMALQSGLKSEVSWALNALTIMSFKDKDDPRRDFTALAKVPGLLDALLFLTQEWRDIAHPRDSAKLARQRLLGANHSYTGWGFEYESTYPGDPIWRLRSAPDNLQKDDGFRDSEKQNKSAEWWWDEEGVFNLDELGRLERQQAAVAASNVLRNFSFMPENENFMAQHRNCLETLILCMQDHLTEDEELVMNAIESVLNLSPFLCIRLFEDGKGQITCKQAIQSFIDMLESPVKAWYCSAAELLGRLVVNPDNEFYLLPVAPQVFKRLIEILGLPGPDGQAAAVGALYNFAEINMDCRVRLANERWAIGRLLRIIQAPPHPMPEVVRKAALTLESLASEPQNRTVMLAYENSFAEIALLDARMSDVFARILWELCSRTNFKAGAPRGVWGS